MVEILYADNRILVCLKPVGVVSTDEPGGLPDLLRQQLGDARACVRTVHRLDQVVGGVMVLARSREAARRLSAQVAGRQFQKQYLAVVQGVPAPAAGCYRDLLVRNKAERKTCVTDQPGRDAREAVLRYRVLEQADDCALVEITLETGRTHQIRAQFSAHGHPLLGDRKYGGQETESAGVALWSHAISFVHPETEEVLRFSAPPPRVHPWTEFPALWEVEQ